jgi:hypothetical protein
MEAFARTISEQATFSEADIATAMQYLQWTYTQGLGAWPVVVLTALSTCTEYHRPKFPPRNLAAMVVA